jgi:LCP family protein required for cell wall assembly
LVTEPEAAKPQPRRMRRRTRWVLACALVLFVVPVAFVTGYGVYLSQVVTSNIHHDNLLPPVIPGGSLATDEPSAGATGAAPVQPVRGKGMNFLLLGSDAGPGREGGRSDVIMLVHVPDDRSKIQLIHFPRDLYVSIPGHGKDKINAAYAYGGAPLLVQTLQNLIGVQIDHVGMIGFEGFKNMTNAVGGVDVIVEESSNESGYVFTKGTMHLNGDQALAFVRERHQLSEGDLSRGRRQQAFLKALILRGLSGDTLTNPARLASFVDAATRNLTVDQNLDIGQMRSLAFSLHNVRGGDIRFITAPLTGLGTSPAGASIDIVDEAKMKTMGQAIANDQLDAYAG